jgi:hypothetical protein
VDIELLRTFLEVRKTRHFGGAAENLHLTSEGERLVGSKSKDYWDNDKNNLSKLKAGGWRDTAG